MSQCPFLQRAQTLSCINLDPRESESLGEDCDRILLFLNALDDIDTENVAPLVTPIVHTAPLRCDTETSSVSASDILRNAPKTFEEFFAIPKFIT